MTGASPCHTEGKDGFRLIALARSKNRGRKIRLIGRIGIVLRLEAESVALLVDMPGLAGDRAVEKIARVELHAGLGRRHVERATALRVLDLRGMTQLARGSV